MKKLLKITALILSVSLMFSACSVDSRRPEDKDDTPPLIGIVSDNRWVVSFGNWPGYEKNLPNVLFDLPEGYTIKDNFDDVPEMAGILLTSLPLYNNDPDVPGEFLVTLPIYNSDNEMVGYIGYNEFTPYEDEIPQEDYYKTVWPGLRLGSMSVWDPFTHVTDIYDSNREIAGESGVADVEYIINTEGYDGRLADAPHANTQAVLAYNKERGMYIGIVFLPDTLTAERITEMRQSVEIK